MLSPAHTPTPRRKPRAPKPFALIERDDPALHRYASLDEALCAALPVIVSAIRQGQATQSHETEEHHVD